MNLTRNVSFAARDYEYGGIYCDNNNGPVFGNSELEVYPEGKEGQLWSWVDYSGFKIPGKVGEMNPLTGNKLVIHPGYSPHSQSILSEIEVWEIVYID